jgi:flagellar assembly protein FliH
MMMPTSDDIFKPFSQPASGKSSGSIIIPKEQLTAFERWELASFDPKPLAKVVAAPVDPAPQIRQANEKLAAEELQNIKQAARDEAYASGFEEGRVAGQEAGHQEGYQAGYTAGSAQALIETEQVQRLMQSLQTALNQIDEQLAQSLLNLSLEIARKMVMETLQVKPEIILKIVSAAIGGLPQFNQNAHLRLNPEDAELVKKHMGEHLSSAGWKIFPDTRVERGGCQVETAHSNVDASNETRWKRIVESIGHDKSWLT